VKVEITPSALRAQTAGPSGHGLTTIIEMVAHSLPIKITARSTGVVAITEVVSII